MHRRVIGSHYYESSVHAGHCRVYESVCGDVHSHVLHAYHAAASGIRHAQSGFHGSFLVRTPCAVDVMSFFGAGILDEFRYFRAWSAGVGVHAFQSGMKSSEGYGLVSQQ